MICAMQQGALTSCKYARHERRLRAQKRTASKDHDVTEDEIMFKVKLATASYISFYRYRLKCYFSKMFFSFSLAIYHTFSSLIRNRHKFLSNGRAQYILPAGSFGRRPPFQDNKRKPPAREFPVEDVSLLLCITPERTLFLDEIYNNFLDLTLIEQQDIFVDFFLKQFEDCLNGLASSITITDVGRHHNLENSNGGNATSLLDGDFGGLFLPTSKCVIGDNSHDAETTLQLLPTISAPRLTTCTGSSKIVAFENYSSTLLPHDVFANDLCRLDSFNHKVCLPTTFIGYSYPAVKASCNQSLSGTGSRCTKYPHHIASAPALHRIVVQRNAESMKVSFCRRVVQYVSYRSTPVTLRVAKISMATGRNCVSLIVFKANDPVAVRRGLLHEERSSIFYYHQPITHFARNVYEDPSLPLPFSEMPSNDPVINPTKNNESQTPVVAINSLQPSIRPNSCCVTNGHEATQNLNNTKHTTPQTLYQKRKDIINSTNDATPEPLSDCDHHLTPQVPVSPWMNRTLGGKAAAAPPSETDFAQHNPKTEAAKNQHPVVAQVRLPGQESRKLSVGTVGAVGGLANTASSLNNPFGWGPCTANLGFHWPMVNKPCRTSTQNPVVGGIGGEVNKQTPICNNIVSGPQAEARGPVWNTSKPCARRRNTDATSFGQTTSHHLLNSRKSNQRAATPLWKTNNNFGLGATNQAAGPAFMLWGANPVVPGSWMKAIPKALSKGPSVDGNNNVVHKYKLPSSCKVIRWSDLEEVNDRRTNMPKTLGSGAYGVVKLMRQTSSGRLCAVKLNRDDVEKQTAIENFKLEVGVLSLLKDLDCVPELLGITTPDTNLQLPVVVQEFIGDSNTLRSVTLLYALKAKVLPAPKAIRVALRVCEAVKEIHSRKLLHCDLKIDNIMLEPNFIRKDNPKIKVIDFGLAVKTDDKPKYQYNSRDDVQWILANCSQVAPEVVRGEKPYNVSSEVYSLGIIFKDLSYRFGGFLQKLGEDCTNQNYNTRPSLEDVIHRIKAHLATNQS